MEFYDSFVKRILIILAIQMVIISLILYCVGLGIYIFGWLWGNVGNFLYVFLLAARVRKTKDLPVDEAVRVMKSSLVSRLALVIVFIVIGSHFSEINLLAVLLGLLTFKPAIYIEHIASKIRNS